MPFPLRCNSNSLRPPGLAWGRQAPSSSLQARGGAAGVGEDDGWRPAHLAAGAPAEGDNLQAANAAPSLRCARVGVVLERTAL